jgi:predicted DNA-binding protein
MASHIIIYNYFKLILMVDIMALKKATYTLPMEAIKQLENLSKRTGKSKSQVVADLIMETETDLDKIINKSVQLESSKDIKFEEMIGKIKTGEKFNPVKIKKSIHKDRVD